MKIHWIVAFILACCGVWVVSNSGYYWRNKLTLNPKKWYGMGRYLAAGPNYKSQVRTAPTFTLKSFKYHSKAGWRIHIKTNKEMIKSWLMK